MHSMKVGNNIGNYISFIDYRQRIEKFAFYCQIDLNINKGTNDF